MTCETQEIRRILAEKHACYVLITCTEPNEKGDMHVEMEYEGDPALASYLIQGAQKVFEEQSE